MKPAMRLVFGSLAVGFCSAAVVSASAAELSKEQQAAAFHDQVQAALQAGEQAGWVVRPDWTLRPDAEDVGRTYPARAKARDISGLVVFACKVTGAGRLAPCEVISEEPQGLGFADGGLQLTRLFKMKPLDAAGVAVEGRLIRLPIAYRIPR